jgi:hypothetical protein
MADTTQAADNNLYAITICQLSFCQLTFAQKCNHPTRQHCPMELTLQALAELHIEIHAWTYKVPLDFMDNYQFVIEMDEMIEVPNNEVSTLADCQMPFSQLTFN